MSQFIQSLESRLLFAATKTTLITDLLHINTDAATVRADLQAAQKLAAADLKTLTADLKGSTNKTTNAADLKQIRKDEATLFATLHADETVLLSSGQSLSRRSTAHGLALLNKSTTANQAKVAADVTALRSVTTAPLAKLLADANTSTVTTDLTKLASDNLTDSTLQTHVGNAKTNLNTSLATFTTAATKFQTDVLVLASDLATLSTTPV